MVAFAIVAEAWKSDVCQSCMVMICMLHLLQTPVDGIWPFLQVWTGLGGLVTLQNKQQCCACCLATCCKAAALPERPKQGTPKAHSAWLCLAAMLSVPLAFLAWPSKGVKAQHLCLAPMVSMSVLSATHHMYRLLVCHVSSPTAIPHAAGLLVCRCRGM